MRFNKIIKPIAFIGIFLIILSVFSAFFVKKTTKEGIGIEEKNTIDYLVIGDSEAYTSVSPIEIWNKHGFTGYNLGVPGQTMQEVYYSLEKALENQIPKVVLLETNAAYTTFGMYVEANRIFENIVKNNFEIYNYHNRWKDISFINQENDDKKLKKPDGNILKGSNYSIKVNAYVKGPYIKETDSVEKIKKVPMYYLNKIVELCNEKNIQLILYTSPTPVNWTYEKHNSIEAFAKENKLPLIDLNLKNDKLRIDWSKDTYDTGDHLNFFGAKKVTNYIGDYLSKNTNLIDHRKNEKYSSWHETWDEYLKLQSRISNK
ncbi:MAG: hypothetical protein E6940_03465 [Clostridium septicum]|uniref:hypothetical protein n=1 Tax=Clostridium septicum TaxID=1504 RepID=UPI00258BA588|nr:hypothetical protein [Clostridium septicum]MDU1313102.1 hypothetical protein [Clostridium septicum]